MTRPRSYDVVVVGSGPAGGGAAKALSDGGLRVLMLDAGLGRRAMKAVDAVDRLRRKVGYRIEEDPAAVRRQPIQSCCYAWVGHPHAFVDDIDNPYSTEHGQRFTWIRSRQAGGRMMVRGHGLQFYRMSDWDFKAGERDGASASWPIAYADLAPYYERVEQWMGIRGSSDGLAHLPDSVLAGAVPLNPGEQRLRSGVERTSCNRTVIPGRTAPAPFPAGGAVRHGRCTLRVGSVVTRITVDTDSGLANGVVYVDRVTGRAREVRARVVVLCASPIESARLLLASATRQHPNGLANSSDCVGRFLMDHTHLSGIAADMPIAPAEASRSLSWAYIPAFRNVRQPDHRFVRGYGVQVFTEGTQCGLTVFGEMLPQAHNRVTLDRERMDKWGVPAAHISCVHGQNELAMLADQIEVCTEMLEAAGFSPWRRITELSPPGLANHEMGTARMGSDPKTSVLNGFCQSWDVRNLFVMDAASFVTQGCQNPTLTILALAARSSDYLLSRFRDL